MDRVFAGFAVGNLLFDPLIGQLEALLERHIRFPVQRLFDEGVVAVTAGHTLGGVQNVSAVQLHAANFFDVIHQSVDRNQLAGTQVNRDGDQVGGVHNLVDAESAVIDIHERTGLG